MTSFSARLVLLCILILGLATSAQAATSAVERLVELCTQRLLLADQVAASKAQTGKAVEDTAREAEQLRTLSTHAKEYRLDPAQVEAFFRWQMEANKLVQYQLLAAPMRAGAEQPMELNEIRIRINALNRELLQTLAPALSELQQGSCAERLSAAIDEHAAQAGLDTLHRTALIRAFGDTCRGL